MKQIMKYALSATVIAFAMTGAANAGAATSSPTVWQGDMFITTNSSTAAACISAGITTGDLVQAIDAPKNLPNNATDQLAVFFLRGSAHQIIPATGTTLKGATSFKVTSINHDRGTKINTQTFSPFQISSVSGTQFVTISVGVADIGNGRNATFNGVLYPRPGNVSE